LFPLLVLDKSYEATPKLKTSRKPGDKRSNAPDSLHNFSHGITVGILPIKKKPV
jgi:hypothetical protein